MDIPQLAFLILSVFTLVFDILSPFSVLCAQAGVELDTAMATLCFLPSSLHLATLGFTDMCLQAWTLTFFS